MSRSLAGSLILSSMAMVIFVSGCVIGSGAPTPGEYCLIAGPIGFSDADTPNTKREIDRHNAKWVCVCEGVCE